MVPAAAMLVLLVQTQSSNAELGYRLTVPDGFRPFPEAKQQQPDLVDCWTEDGDNALVMCVQRMRGVLPREAMKPDDVPPSAQLQTFQWKSFDVQGLRSEATQNGQRVFVLVAQVPLKREAVQLTVAGGVREEARGRTTMDAVLASLEGESNWLSATDRAGRLGTIAGWIIGIGIGVLLVRMWRKRRA